MAQQNYFSYNIIDALYFNKPTGDDLETVYGIDTNFVRRNPSQNYGEEYDEEEKKFIQAVINKYVTGDFSNIDIKTKGDITYAYFKTNKEIGIELADMLSNVNGTHNYKLLSAKDIDFDNVILPNSGIPNDFNWGAFDVNRRWGDKPIRINNTFELLNVIDYLLCACENIWNELYKIKYNTNDSVQIWFCKDTSVDISLTNQLISDDFKIDSNGYPNKKMITYLDPFNYYTVLENNNDNKFGIVTDFYTTQNDHDLEFDRKTVNTKSRNIILLVIIPQNKLINNNSVNQDKAYVNGALKSIFAYKIGNELKLYPGSRIESFEDKSLGIKDYLSLIDFENKKLTKETYFKLDKETFTKVYIEFLNEKYFQNYYDYYAPFILYYLNEDNKKIILRAGHRYNENIEENEENIIDIIIGNNNNSYSTIDFNNIQSTDRVYEENGKNYPYFYAINDEFKSILEIATPNSSLFSSNSKSITIYYYKNNNKLNCKITKLKNGEEFEIKPENDPTQDNAMSYNYSRYNIPSGEEITFTFDATYITNGENDNPLNIKLDDEYEDIMLFDRKSIDTDVEAQKYYKYDGYDDNNYKRNFTQYTSNTIKEDNYISMDSLSNEFKQVWVKTENPYQLKLRIDNNEMINQDLSFEEVNNQINNLKNNFSKTSYNTYQFSYTLGYSDTLGEDIEQVKMNLHFYINETSKVKSVDCLVPININKIYSPTINYYSYTGLLKENSYYGNIIYSNANGFKSLADLNRLMFRKYGINNIGNVSNICFLMTGENLDDFNDEKTYNCITNNSYFEITYNYQNNIVNLLGSYFIEKDSKNIENNYANIKLITKQNDNNYSSKEISTNNKPYIFNINGLSKNYRMHGKDKTLPDGLEDQLININNLDKYFTYYDLLSVASINEKNPFTSYLKFKISDKNNNDIYQLGYINVEKNIDQNIENNEEETNSSEEINLWVDNKTEENYYSGLKDNKYSYIETVPVDIIKKSHMTTIGNISYYIPLSYMVVKSSTFYPPISTQPKSYLPDINDSDDLERYNNYISLWDNDNDYYRPITLSLKLFENTTMPNPYYYESNEAVIKFNIKRENISSNTLNLNGKDNIIYVALNSKYYISDFVNFGNSNSLSENIIPTGSYFYYDEKVCSYLIKEIPCNYKINNNGNNLLKEHNSHYDNISYNVFNYALNQNNNVEIPYPIFYNEIKEENQNYEIDNTTYNYDIYRIADINKIKLSPEKIGKTLSLYDSDGNELGDNNNYSVYGLKVNNIEDGGNSLLTLDITEDFKNNFYKDENFAIVNFNIHFNGIYGSKNLLAPSTNVQGRTITRIYPIVRIRPSYPMNIEEDNYQSLTIGEKTYEFFEFKYENVYEIDFPTKGKTPLAPSKDKSMEDAYFDQLKLFLSNNPDKFIVTKDYELTENTQNSTIDNVQENSDDNP